MTTQPTGVYHRIGDIECIINPDGSLTLDTGRQGEQLVKLPAEDVYALYVFLAKLPHVGPLLERLEGQRQTAFFDRMERDVNASIARQAVQRTERDRIEAAIQARYPQWPIAGESAGDYERRRIAAADELAELWRLVGDVDRRAFWQKEAATMRQHLAEIEAEQATALTSERPDDQS